MLTSNPRYNDPGTTFVSDIAIFVLKRDVKLQLTNPGTTVLWPFVWDYLGEPVPEETLTHPSF